MVKLKGPSLTLSAAGGLGKTIAFAESKGRAYLKRWHKPKNPQTNLQRSVRAINSLLSREWRNLSSADQATWQQLADETNVSPFNAYQAFNLNRWTRFRPPTQAYPPAEIVPAVVQSGMSATGATRSILVSWSISSSANNWSAGIFNTPSAGAPPTRQTLIRIEPWSGTGTFTWRWTPLAPGTYYIAIKHLGASGEFWPFFGWRTAIVA